MMKLLALDTSTELCSVSVLNQAQTFAQSLHAKNQHTALLLRMIDDVLKKAQLELKELDAIALGVGPGSFTGVRIAMSVAQGLAYGIKKPLIGLSTLQIMAQQAYLQFKVTRARVALDARMQQIYYGYYILDDEKIMQLYGSESLLSPNELLIEEGCGVGNGWQVYQETLQHNTVDAIYPDVSPQASAALVLAENAFQKGLAVEPTKITPVYLRDNVTQK